MQIEAPLRILLKRPSTNVSVDITSSLLSSRQMEFAEGYVVIQFPYENYNNILQVAFYQTGVAVQIYFYDHSSYSWLDTFMLDPPAYSGRRRGLLGNMQGDPFLSYAADADYAYTYQQYGRNFTYLSFYSNVSFINELNSCKLKCLAIYLNNKLYIVILAVCYLYIKKY